MSGISRKFENAMMEAVRRREKGDKRMRSLSICIEGPAQSGKTHIARQHIEELAKHGLVDKGKIAQFYHGDLDRMLTRDRSEIDRAFDRADGGAIIIDDISPLRTQEGREMQYYLERKIVESISSDKCVVILAGSPEGMEQFRENSPLMARMCDFIAITKEADTALAHPTKALQPLRFVKPPDTRK